ncbi:GDSL-type esterase/lipase family protein [Domibacillus indicus]|uniref:GDSL-type esterase/lipase family protein n=1 Tax=Domibacillus indicus TaxID=1437523 RepID=UPI002041B7C7|nr:GDSL-type esterase/lipase family protein [Domibacillus indicus]MCM3790603.1 GDSL-type esterase/lipase family protein [Domibacillus indicus]
MKKPLNVLAASLVAGTVLTSSLSPAFTENAQAATENNLSPLNAKAASVSFTDTEGTRYEEAVAFLYESGIINGFPDLTFGVNQPVKRVDAAVILGKYMGLHAKYPNPPVSGFTDVPERAALYVSALKAAGVVNGKTTTEFGSGSNITRGEAAIMLYNALKHSLDTNNEPTPFTDVKGTRYEEAVRALTDPGIIAGITKTSYGSSASITRGALALLIHRAYQYQQSLFNEEKSGFIAFGDSNTSGSYFQADYPEYQDHKWTDQVAALYSQDMEADVYNAGYSGNTTEQGMKRFKTEVLDLNPGIVSIMFGINDALIPPNGTQPQVSKETFKQNLTSMIAQLRARNAQVILMTNPPAVEETYYTSQLAKHPHIASKYAGKGGLRKWIDSYNDIIRQVAREQAVPLVDVYDLLIDEVGAETDAAIIKSGLIDEKVGIHLTPKSNDIVAQAVKEVLSEEDNEYLPYKSGVSIKTDKEVYDLSADKSVKITLSSITPESYYFTPGTLQKRVNNKWVTVEHTDDFTPLPAVASLLRFNQAMSDSISLDSKLYKEPLTAGDYRVVHSLANAEDVQNESLSLVLSTEFKMIE